MKRVKLYFWLFGINLFISTFTFGGGYVIVPMIRKYYVERKALFSEEELLDLAAVAQSAPGAIAVNLSALAGYRAAGVAGIALCSAAAILPPLVIMTAVSKWYALFAANQIVSAVLRGMQAGVAAVVVDYIVDMIRVITKERSLLLLLLVPAVFAANFFLHVHVAFLLLACCILCVARVWYFKKRGKSE
ncbi:MAG: chromate transporter [Clostridia bacterium]